MEIIIGKRVLLKLKDFNNLIFLLQIRMYLMKIKINRSRRMKKSRIVVMQKMKLLNLDVLTLLQVEKIVKQFYKIYLLVKMLLTNRAKYPFNNPFKMAILCPFVLHRIIKACGILRKIIFFIKMKIKYNLMSKHKSIKKIKTNWKMMPSLIKCQFKAKIFIILLYIRFHIAVKIAVNIMEWREFLLLKASLYFKINNFCKTL